MGLSILNSVSSMTAENALSNTQAALQKTLNRLSTGLRINGGSDDAAGLSIVTGMQGNIAALTQSQQNATNGIGMLQTADGALSQVSAMLNRAVTLATEAATTGISDSQYTALNNEFVSVMAEIDQIGQTTNFNGKNVFTPNTVQSFSSTNTTAVATTSALTSGSVTTITDGSTGKTFTFTAGGSSKISDLITAISAAVTAKTLSASVTGAVDTSTPAKLVISTGEAAGITVTTNDTVLGAVVSGNSMAAAPGIYNTSTVFIGDGTSSDKAQTTISTFISELSTTGGGVAGLTGLGITGDLLSSANAAAVLTKITTAIDTVSSQRGAIGASVNRLTAATNNMSNAVNNLQSATNSIQNADIGKTVADMTQYNVLQSTGMSALQQSNQAQQAVLKLIQ